MAQSKVEEILASRRPNSESSPAAPTTDGDKFSLILLGDKMEEHFLELKFRTGNRTSFPYSAIMYLNYDPDSGFLDVEFGVCLVSIRGRGLGERVYDGIKQKRVVWLKEADSEMQDHAGNDLYIGEIVILPAESGQTAAA